MRGFACARKLLKCRKYTANRVRFPKSAVFGRAFDYYKTVNLRESAAREIFVNLLSAARRGGFFAALFRLRVQCIFFPAGEYTYSILAKMKNEGRKRRGSGVHFAAIAPQNGEGGGVPFAACVHMRRPSSGGALPIYTRAYPLFIVGTARPQPIFAARAYEKIRPGRFRQKKPHSAKILQIICLRIRYNQEEERE